MVSLKNNAVGAGWNPEILAEQQIALLSFCGIKTWVAVFDVYSSIENLALWTRSEPIGSAIKNR